jgi:hypothetical protein
MKLPYVQFDKTERVDSINNQIIGVVNVVELEPNTAPKVHSMESNSFAALEGGSVRARNSINL